MFVEFFLIGVALAMDAFAVSMCKGLSMRRLNYRRAFVISLFFGGFQALAPFLGWALGSQFGRFISPVDHWIAFALLDCIGGKMIWDALREPEEEAAPPEEERLDLRELLLLAVATSVDALAVGVGFAVLNAPVLPAVSVIGLVTFCLSWIGVVVGNRCGMRYEKKAQIAGGAVLLAIGLKILLEHLNALPF